MFDINEVPYAEWLEKSLQAIVPLKPVCLCFAATMPDGKLKSKKLPTVRVEAENRLNAVVAAAQKWGVGWTGVARGVECEIIGPAKKKGDKNE